MSQATYIVDGMAGLYVIEVESEVRAWLELLPAKVYRKVRTILAESWPQTPMPYARPLRDGVYELRPTPDGVETRVTYWIANDRRIVLLTVFRKTRAHEEAQINRAVLAKKQCEAEHRPAHEEFTREEGDP
jgi:hypothetical protein